MLNKKNFGLFTFAVFLAALLLFSCGKKDNDFNLVELKGGIKGGGLFTTNETENIRSLDPTGINDVVSHHVSHQIYDLLIDLDSNMNLKPTLATRWEISEDGLTYTFHLRKGVYFHDNACFPNGKGREFYAEDAKYSFNRILDPRTGSLGFDYYKNYVEGAKEFIDEVSKSISENRDPKIKDVSGFIAKDDSTFVIKLKKPFGPFIYYMCLGFAYVVPREAVEKYGKDFFQNPVGTGPFIFENWTPDLEINMRKNPNYWEKDEFGNNIPYLDKVKFRFIKDISQQLLEFKNGNIDDSYRIPTELTSSIVNEDGSLTPEYSKFILQVKNAYAIQYYGFLTNGKIFSNPKVRQAFNYAIDRERIIKYVLKGTGTPAVYGVVPPGMPGYDIKNIKGYSYDLEKAKQLMNEAGYPGGKGFPEVTLNINEGGGRNIQVMEALQNMLKELGISIKIQTLQFAQHLDNLDAGRSDFYRLGWIADYPDPENFLNLFYGKNVPANPKEKSPINSFRYINPKYDELFEQALRISDMTERYKIYQQAEQIAVNEAPVLFIFYDVDYRLVQPYVRGFALDPMHRVNMRYTWLDK
ncbi:MAG: ABC transporter substrate-binding protein [Chlorobi bacterium]|nr:ABC transporter substrate-binding protein [Chlorobiota bacterium]MCI0714927.1 ABC transporter substrate-binding protein [Chlorobiota bacterium]